MIDDVWSRVEGSGVEEWLCPVSTETLEPLACFVGKLPKDSDFADQEFPGLEIGISSVGLPPITRLLQLRDPDKLVLSPEILH